MKTIERIAIVVVVLSALIIILDAAPVGANVGSHMLDLLWWIRR